MVREDVIDLVKLFGLTVDLDKWDTAGWMRIKSDDFPNDYGYKNNCLILYQADGYEVILDELRNSLINLGGNLKAKSIRKELSL